MKSRVIEEIALQSERLVIQLFPLQHRLDAHIHRRKIQRLRSNRRSTSARGTWCTRQRRSRQRRNRPHLRWHHRSILRRSRGMPVQKFFSVRRNVERQNVVHYFVGPPRLQFKPVRRQRARAVQGIDQRPLQEQQHTFFARNQFRIIPRRNRHRQNSLPDFLEIHFHNRRRLFLSLVRLSGFCRIRLRSVSLRLALLIAQGSQRRRQI